MNCFYDAISQMLRKHVERRALLDNMDGAFLALDEICDNGQVKFKNLGIDTTIDMIFRERALASEVQPRVQSLV